MDDVSIAFEILKSQDDTVTELLRSARNGDLDVVWTADQSTFGENGVRAIRNLRETVAELHEELWRRYG